MKIIDGKKIADNILVALNEQVKRCSHQPKLATILIGGNVASQLYVSLKAKAAQKIGVNFEKYVFGADVNEREIVKIIEKLNQDDTIQGILVQLPLPPRLATDKIIRAISLEKDVDGFLLASAFDSPFILAIWEALKATDVGLENKKMAALVNSAIFGDKLKDFFKKKNLEINVYKNDTRTKHNIGEADVLITACGCPGFIKDDMIKDGVILLDGGIAQQDGRIVGDVDVASVKEKAGWLAPVPGGIGPITVAMLLRNIVASAQKI